jgi:hypothetical protein
VHDDKSLLTRAMLGGTILKSAGFAIGVEGLRHVRDKQLLLATCGTDAMPANCAHANPRCRFAHNRISAVSHLSRADGALADCGHGPQCLLGEVVCDGAQQLLHEVQHILKGHNRRQTPMK